MPFSRSETLTGPEPCSEIVLLPPGPLIDNWVSVPLPNGSALVPVTLTNESRFERSWARDAPLSKALTSSESPVAIEKFSIKALAELPMRKVSFD